MSAARDLNDSLSAEDIETLEASIEELRAAGFDELADRLEAAADRAREAAADG